MPLVVKNLPALTSVYLLGEGEFQDGSLDLHPWCRRSEPGVGGIPLHG